MLVLALASASFLAINMSVINAQNTITATDFVSTPTPGDNGQAFQIPPTLSPEEERSEAQDATERARKFNSCSIFDFHIAYLIKQSLTSPDSLVSSENISRITGAKVVHSWEEFIQINEQQPFQMVFIHGSMYDQNEKFEMIAIIAEFDWSADIKYIRTFAHTVSPSRRNKFRNLFPKC